MMVGEFWVGALWGLVLSFSLSAILGAWLGVAAGYGEAMAEAFERGHAVQCLGKDGYFWECEE